MPRVKSKLTGRAISLKQLAEEMLLGKRGKKKMGERKERERELWKSLEWRYYENGWSVRASKVHTVDTYNTREKERKEGRIDMRFKLGPLN